MKTIKFLLTNGCFILLTSLSLSAQLNVEHTGSTASPNVLVEDKSMNNFTRFFMGNTNTTKTWRLSSRAFTGGVETNLFDINYYDGTATTNYIRIDAEAERMTMKKDARVDGQFFVNTDGIINYDGQASIYTDDRDYGAVIQNKFISDNFKTGAFISCSGDGNGDRIGVHGLAVADVGSAHGVYGAAAGGPSDNEYGVFGTATGASGFSWGVFCSGDFYYSGSMTTPSDKRLKKNITDLNTNVLSKVLQLKAKEYEYDNDLYPSMNFAKGPQIGFLAQELQAVFPEMVAEQTHEVYDVPGDITSKKSKIEILGVDYMKMIPVLTAAIQEQNEIINELRNEISEIKESLK